MSFEKTMLQFPSRHFNTRKSKLERVGNVPLGKDERFARNPNDAFVRPATNRWRQLPHRFGSNVAANNGEIPAVEF